MKDINECRERLRGIFNITVTPFTASGVIDFPALRENIERVIGLGYDGLLIGGTYGEFPVMTVEERRELFHQVMACVDDRVAVMLCSASADPRDARELTLLASELGGLPMVTAPFVSEITDQQIVSYFKEMAPLSKTGILVYNAPGIGITLSPGAAGTTGRDSQRGRHQTGRSQPHRHRPDCQPSAWASAPVLCFRSGLPRANDGRV